MNPACMKNTRKAVTSTQTVLMRADQVLGRYRRSAGLGAGGGLEEPEKALDGSEDGNDADHLAAKDGQYEPSGVLLLSKPFQFPLIMM